MEFINPFAKLEEMLNKKFPLKRITTPEEAQARIGQLNRRLIIILAVVVGLFLFFKITAPITSKLPDVFGEAVMGILTAAILVAIALFVSTFSERRSMQYHIKLFKELICPKCGAMYGPDDAKDFFAGKESLTTSTSTTTSVKSAYKDESPETLAARKYIGQEIYETKTTTHTESSLPVFVTFVCPECGEKEVIEKLIKDTKHQDATKESAENYFLGHYFPTYRF